MAVAGRTPVITASVEKAAAAKTIMEALRNGTVATEGARLTYQEVHAVGPAQDPLPEVFQPTIYPGESNKEVVIAPLEEGEPETADQLFVVKSNNPHQGYMLMGKPSKLLGHHATGWGELFFAVIFPRAYEGNISGLLKFRAPVPEEARLVAIKKLNKLVVKDYLNRGGHEDPYKEISRMQELGDGVHVLACEEALEDEKYLYIITNYSNQGSLLEGLTLGMGLPEAEALAYFKNILEILLYLERHGIFHHDISPDNFLFFNGRLLLFDFAMSLRIPKEKPKQDSQPERKKRLRDDELAGCRRFLMKPQGVYGTLPCQAPEVFFNKPPFDGIAADLWSATVTLYTLLTGLVLYKVPHPADITFRYYILAGGLQPGLNEQMVDVLESAFQPGQDQEYQDNLMNHAMANLNISPDARELLVNSLQMNPAARWTLMQTVESPWVQANLG